MSEQEITQSCTREAVLMQLTLNPDGGPRHQQIYAAFRAAILNGTLRHGDRLPSTRVLARDLGVSRTTVLGAFSRLLAEGYVNGNSGAGTRVASLLPGPRGEPAPPEATARSAMRDTPSVRSASTGDGAHALSKAARTLIAEGRWRTAPTEATPFAVGIPALELFPLTAWTRLAARRWRLSGRDLLLPADPQGYAPLREAVARYVVTARGVRCTAEQVLITNGAQHALDLCARLLVGPGDAVWMESPSYLPARGVFAATGARLINVPVDADGLDVARGCRLAAEAKVAYG